MNIPRDLALEIFDLKENFSTQDLSNAYRRLAKITHPDSGGDKNLFILIKECKDVLEHNVQNSNSNIEEEKKSNENNTNSKSLSDIDLDLLYNEYYNLNKHMKEFDFRNIYTYIKVYIHPCFKKSHQQNFNIITLTPFEDFLDLNRKLVSFTKTIYLPKDFKKFYLFKVSLVFSDKTHSFYISKNAFKKIVHDNWRFKTIFNLSFRTPND